jgi:exodeoxyribonuclease VII small subunit
MTTVKEGEKDVSYNNRLFRVEKLVEELGRGDLSLDDVVGKVEEGYKLIAELKQKLSDTKMRVEHLRQKFEESDKEPK